MVTVLFDPELLTGKTLRVPFALTVRDYTRVL